MSLPASVLSVIDTVAKHLAGQRRQARGPQECQYRGEGGCMCSVGALIPDEVYDPEMEGDAAYALQNFEPAWAHLTSLMPELGVQHLLDVFEELQGYHDADARSERHTYLEDLQTYAGFSDAALATVIAGHLTTRITPALESRE